MKDGVQKRDDDGAWMVVEDEGMEVVDATAEGAEEGRRGG